MAGVAHAFAVNPVSEPARVLKRLPGDTLSAAWLGGMKRVVAHSRKPPHAVLCHGKHALLAVAVHTAFYDHCPLVLSPDAIWVTQLQGLAQHCAQPTTSEDAVRAAWGVTHEGKKETRVERDDDYLAPGPHDWSGVITEFSNQIGGVIGQERLDFAECGFSTSTFTDRLVSRIALLDSVQRFFDLILFCGCGIPWVALRGTPADWRQLRARAAKLRSFPDLAWWCDELEPVLDQLVAAAQGQPDTAFWASMCNLAGGSGSRLPISGWIQVLYPYLNSEEQFDGDAAGRHEPWVSGVKGATLCRNEYLGEWRREYKHAQRTGGATGDVSVEDHSYPRASGNGPPLGRHCGQGVPLEDIPAGLSSAPLALTYVGSDTSVPMALLGGLAVITQDPGTLALELHTGWAVAQRMTAADAEAAAAETEE